MNIFDIIGPVMVGPSSSHTAGVVKIGRAARQLLGEPVVRAEVLLYGSLLATGRGHGTDRAVVAGLLGLRPDDEDVVRSLELAEQAGMEVVFGEARLREAHSNSVLLQLTGFSGRYMEILGESLGGAVINIRSVNGTETNFSGEQPTLIVYYADEPGRVSRITSILARMGVNIAEMRVTRADRGGEAVAVIECDQEIDMEDEKIAGTLSGMDSVLYYSPGEDAR